MCVYGCCLPVALILARHTLTHTTHSKRFGVKDYEGSVVSRSVEGLATDAKPRYWIHYDDGDKEELYTEEILPILQVGVCACV